MSNSQGLSVAEETAIVAYIARGDRYADIRAQMIEHYGRSVSVATICLVKKRNAEHLKEIKEKTLVKQEADAMALRDQANRTIKKHLDSSETIAEVLARASQQYIDGEITFKEYKSLVRSLKQASLPELVTVSKEMHAQAGKAPDAGQSAEDLAAIRAALESGDEVTLNQLIFKKNQPSNG